MAFWWKAASTATTTAACQNGKKYQSPDRSSFWFCGMVMMLHVTKIIVVVALS
jgi:hypothetical protein